MTRAAMAGKNDRIVMSARSLAALFVWQRTGRRRALMMGGVVVLVFWLASGWLAWVVTR